MERMVELLLEEIMERLAARQERAAVSVSRPAEDKVGPARVTFERGPEPLPPFLDERSQAAPGDEAASGDEAIPDGQEVGAPAPAPWPEPGAVSEPSHATRLMRRMAVWLCLAVVLINIPFNRHGVTLATAMPDSAALVVRDGLVVKEEDDPEIYVYQDGVFRWISSLDAFEHYGYTWRDVHIVPDGYLAGYEIGAPIHVLLKCEQSPHIYRLEEGEKRWIRDIDTFTAEGHVWEDVRFVSCSYLRSLPDGETIPPDEGPPPQP
jgi:hypothetical protein